MKPSTLYPIKHNLLYPLRLIVYPIISKFSYKDVKRKWHKLLKDLEIEYRKIYCTRHTFITAMLNSNQYKLLTVAKIVGHSSIKTLMTSYAGFIKDDHLKINVDLDIFRESSVKVTKVMKI